MAFSLVRPFPQKISASNIEAWIRKQKRYRTVNKFVWHHTWRPTTASWNGAVTMNAMKNRYQNTLGWNAGPHFFVAEDGIWAMTPINVQGIHASSGNYKSIGIEIVGNYNFKRWSKHTLLNAQALGQALHKVYKLPINDSTVRMHRDYSSKTCPGRVITRNYIKKQLTTNITEMNNANAKFITEKILGAKPSQAFYKTVLNKVKNEGIDWVVKQDNWKRYNERASQYYKLEKLYKDSQIANNDCEVSLKECKLSNKKDLMDYTIGELITGIVNKFKGGA